MSTISVTRYPPLLCCIMVATIPGTWRAQNSSPVLIRTKLIDMFGKASLRKDLLNPRGMLYSSKVSLHFCMDGKNHVVASLDGMPLDSTTVSTRIIDFELESAVSPLWTLEYTTLTRLCRILFSIVNIWQFSSPHGTNQKHFARSLQTCIQIQGLPLHSKHKTSK